jgi:tetratricopeptide (TPR) repeat protein
MGLVMKYYKLIAIVILLNIFILLSLGCAASRSFVSDLHLGRGDMYFSQSMPGYALEEFNLAIQINPNNYQAFADRGELFLATEDYQRAIDNSEELERISPLNPNSYITRAWAYLDLKQYDSAIKYANKALSLGPLVAVSVYTVLGEVYYYTGKYEQSILVLSTGIVLKPNNAGAYNYRGLCKAALDDYSGAVLDYSKSIEIDAVYSDPYFNRGLAEINLSMKAEAINDFTKYISLSQDQLNISLAQQYISQLS